MRSALGIAALPRQPAPYMRADNEVFAPIELRPTIKKHLRPVGYGAGSPLAGRVSIVEGWENWGMEKRLAFMREVVQDTARDPAISTKATQILNAARAPNRAHREQWAALLKYVQENIRYNNERDEKLQSPQFSLTVKHGDCDDLAILLAALGDSMRLPWRFVISGRDKAGKRVRWVEGVGPLPDAATWSHIYVCVGWPPFKPELWTYAEPTLPVPLGWDAHNAKDRKILRDRPDMAGAFAGHGALGEETAPLTTAPILVASGTSSVGEGLFSRMHTAVKGLPWAQITTGVLTASFSFLATQQLVKLSTRKSQRSRR